MTRKVVLPQSYPVFIKSDGVIYWVGWAKDIHDAAVICDGFHLVAAGGKNTIIVDVKPVDVKIESGRVPRPDFVDPFCPNPSLEVLMEWRKRYYLLDVDDD